MKFLTNLFKSMTPGPSSDFWYEDAGMASSAGVRVSADTAMQIAAVYACQKVISDAIATLPLVLYRRFPDGSKAEAADHPLYKLLKYQPNSIQTRFNFMHMLTGHVGLRGNFYSQMVLGRDGQVKALRPLHPARMTTEVLPDYSLRFKYQDSNGKQLSFNQGDLFRVCGLSGDGIKGYSVIEQVSGPFGASVQTQEYANRFFANDARPGGILQADKPMEDKVRDANKASWERAHRGAQNSHKVAILYGLTWQQLGITNEASQFLETRKFTRSEICGLFGVPPHMIGDLDRATFSNIEHQDIGFYKQTILPWLVNIEQSIKRDLILEDDIYPEFKAEGLLRGDSASRSGYYQKALGAGNAPAWMTPNEVRRLENMNPIEGGDELPKPVGSNPQSNEGKNGNA